MSEGFRWDDLRRWRSMDQLVNTPYQVEGFKLWGEMKTGTQAFITKAMVKVLRMFPHRL